MREGLVTMALAAVVAATPVFAANYDRRAFGAAVDRIGDALRDAEYDHLEALHDEFSQAGARTSDGTPLLRAFQYAFEARYMLRAAPAIEDDFAKWKVARPASRLRPIAEAFAWQQRAWVVKGTGCYAEQPANARKAFNALLDRSAAALRKSEVQGRDSALWHTAAMLVAGGQSRSAAELDGLLAEGARRFPGYEPLYAARLTFLLPAWGGSWDTLDAFVRSAQRATAALEGRAFYAWLYVELAAARGCDDLFGGSGVDWPEMKAAFEDLVQRHPDAWNRNLYATFACRSRDVATTQRLLEELGKGAQLGAWSNGITTHGCHEMVQPERDEGAGK